ncbi:MAG: hypothetical protein U5O39_13270 [Gammaproteobacteria bacterium]|nr:hypothetical protein [Gammaproteobacteria bacterium]
MMVFLLFLATLALNVGDNLIARIGFESNYGLILLLSILFTVTVLAGRNIYIIGAAVILCLVANMPAEFSLNFGVDRDYYAGLMLALLMQPFFARILN